MRPPGRSIAQLLIFQLLNCVCSEYVTVTRNIAMRDTWLEERMEQDRASSPPPGHRWLAEWTPQEVATAQRLAWDGRELTGNHYLKSNLVEGHVQATWFHDLIDRTINHTKDHHYLNSQLRADDNFVGLCAQRLGPTPPLQPFDATTRQRIAERRLADEERVRQRHQQRVERQKAAERIMLAAPKPGSRQAKRQRELREATRPASARSASFAAARVASAPGSSAPEAGWSRWQRQFADGKAHTERLTGRYVHSLGDLGRCERVPAGRRSPGRQRVTEGKAHAWFSGSLRGYAGSPSSSPRLHAADWKTTEGGLGGSAAGGRAPWRVSDWRPARGKAIVPHSGGGGARSARGGGSVSL